MSTSLRLTLVALMIGGGFTGIATIVQAMSAPTPQAAATVWIFIGFFALYAFVLIAGLLLVHNPRRVAPALVALALQIPVVSSSVIAYRLTSGLDFVVAVNSDRLTFGYQFGSFAQFNYNQHLPFEIGLNLVAVILFLLTLTAMVRMRRNVVVGPKPRTADA